MSRMKSVYQHVMEVTNEITTATNCAMCRHNKHGCDMDTIRAGISDDWSHCTVVFEIVGRVACGNMYGISERDEVIEALQESK